MKFSGNMSIKIILKVTKNQGFILSLGDTFSKKPPGGEGGVKLTTPSRFRVKSTEISLTATLDALQMVHNTNTVFVQSTSDGRVIVVEVIK